MGWSVMLLSSVEVLDVMEGVLQEIWEHDNLVDQTLSGHKLTTCRISQQQIKCC